MQPASLCRSDKHSVASFEQQRWFMSVLGEKYPRVGSYRVMSSSGNANESNNTPKMPFIKELMVQCGRCLKWRLIPSMQKYEILREKHVESPLFCEAASEWEPNMSCEVPGYETSCDIWAIDAPSIPSPPSGWRRLVQVRREYEKTFADVYYYPPAPLSNIRLRSQSEVKKFLESHPEYTREGVNMSQFSFKSPKRLEDYMKKRNRQEPNATTECEVGYRASQHGQPSKKTKI
ncbi:putative methyl-CpG-binding domain protein 12 isoform X2 [Capsella rubella]|uniref:putative methyl-CpG-binding domain protein 12 isoform X2 n=1 Tax=Capsella rubella TaxID=81985 RepID=UPI000CD56568|nr:putative methyl-CpG-binding domain protein 12 isoform X2 [Capsella rubella]